MKKIRELISKVIYEIKLIPSRILIFWDSLYNGDDEFHESLDLNISVMLKMNDEDRITYVQNLVKRRNQAHIKGLKNENCLQIE